MQLALEKKERLSPSPCMHTASIWGEGKFCLDREFFKNAPYNQKIIFHLVSSNKMSQKKIFFAWTVDQWYIGFTPLPLAVVCARCTFGFSVSRIWDICAAGTDFTTILLACNAFKFG